MAVIFLSALSSIMLHKVASKGSAQATARQRSKMVARELGGQRYSARDGGMITAVSVVVERLSSRSIERVWAGEALGEVQ